VLLWRALIGGTKGSGTSYSSRPRSFDQFRYEVDDLVDAGDSVLVLGRIRVRGVQSGATGAQHGAILFQLRDGLIVGYRSYLDREEALAAAGLGERD
jgi:ketosteroid isomerase-like protein